MQDLANTLEHTLDLPTILPHGARIDPTSDGFLLWLPSCACSSPVHQGCPACNRLQAQLTSCEPPRALHVLCPPAGARRTASSMHVLVLNTGGACWVHVQWKRHGRLRKGVHMELMAVFAMQSNPARCPTLVSATASSLGRRSAMTLAMVRAYSPLPCQSTVQWSAKVLPPGIGV